MTYLSFYIEKQGYFFSPFHSIFHHRVWVISNLMPLKYGSLILTKMRHRFFLFFRRPTPEPLHLLQRVMWPKAREYNFQYLDFNVDLNIKSHPKDDAYRKWVQLYEKMAVKPYDTF